MPVVEVLREAVTGSLYNIFQMACFIIPIMFFIEVLRDLNVLDRLAGLGAPLSRLYRMPREACLPLFAGLIFGIAFGAGVILNSIREGHLSIRDIYIINVFLVICHGVIDDTVLFIAIGAEGWLLVVPRVVTALIVCYFMSRVFKPPADHLPQPVPTAPGDGKADSPL
ncbi:MAG: nucleoside recognition protein [Candidatus Desulforudis sp.]|nr:nucleoside recognition protein [Desulforudis sp.]